MISELLVTNFAIIDELRAEFSPGFNAITGETGAGKTILVEALSSLLLSKANAKGVRNESEFSRIEARFEVDDRSHDKLFDGGSLIASRKTFPEGKCKCWINGSPCTATVLSTTMKDFLHYQGQHESQRLFDPIEQLKIIDSFQPEKTKPVLEVYGKIYSRFLEIDAEIKRIDSDERSKARDIERLRFEVDEIDRAKLTPGEPEELEKEVLICRNYANLSESISKALQAITEGAEGTNARDLVFSALKNLTGVSGLDQDLDACASALEAAGHQLNEVVNDLRAFMERVDFDPARLDSLEERLNLIRSLKRKYGDTVEEILEYRESSNSKLSLLENSELSLTALKEERARIVDELKEKAEELSAVRRSMGERLVEGLKEELSDLGITKCSLEIEFNADRSSEGQYNFGPDGFDEVEFLISTNPGEPVKALRKIASGGELSRFMLSLQSLSSAPRREATLIFDEVDSGIGGSTAVMVGKKLRKISSGLQIICITHLPQIAALADRHFHVSKKVSGGRTVVEIEDLNEEKRVLEIARMISGKKKSETSLKQARELMGMRK